MFSDDTVALMHHTARGLLRAINNLATQALVAAFAQDKGIMDESCARAAIVGVTPSSASRRETRHH
jgi:type II secretory pathway predicted ATPase ExeA